MNFLALGAILLTIGLLFLVLRVRKSSITGEKSRNRHFQHLAKDLDFQFVTDDYFVQLEGLRDSRRIILYPHNFEGPGLVTLLYLETALSARDRNWIEPNLSLGRALVEWKKQEPFGYEITGADLRDTNIHDRLKVLQRDYPYVAITLPWRFSYSPLLEKSLGSWKNYAVFLAMDAGRRPQKPEIEKAIANAVGLAHTLGS